MDLNAYRAYTVELSAKLTGDPRVLGLVALGSMAERDRMPDQFSDHDFFVIVRGGEQEWFRGERSWLPDPASVVLFFRETPHGCKAVYASGHLVEFAIFDPEEIALARVNDYRVLLDRERIAERVAEVARSTAATPPADRRWLAGQLLTNLLVAALRGRRGETLSARSMFTGAVRHLAQLVAARVPTEGAERGDNLDPLRRFERLYPQLAGEIEAASRCDVIEGASRLLSLYERVAAEPGELEAIEAIRSVLPRS